MHCSSMRRKSGCGVLILRTYIVIKAEREAEAEYWNGDIFLSCTARYRSLLLRVGFGRRTLTLRLTYLSYRALCWHCSLARYDSIDITFAEWIIAANMPVPWLVHFKSFFLAAFFYDFLRLDSSRKFYEGVKRVTLFVTVILIRWVGTMKWNYVGERFISMGWKGVERWESVKFKVRKIRYL